MGRRAVTGTEVKQWQELHRKGKTYHQIAAMFERASATVHRHLNPFAKEKELERHRQKYRGLTPEQKQELWAKRRDYQRSYHRGYKRNG